jgi:O-antigen ligase
MAGRGEMPQNPQAWIGTLPGRVAHVPNWLESLLFLALMSGPPKFRGRDPFASLAGTVDAVVAIHAVIWTCGGLWVLARLYPAVLRGRGVPVNGAQLVGALFIASLTLSLPQSPGVLLTAFTLGQFAVMLSFAWVFTHRFGTASCLRHIFLGVVILTFATIAAVYLAPGLVTEESGLVAFESRLRGDYIADTGSLAVIGLVLSLSNAAPLRGPTFWALFGMFGGLLFLSRTRSAYVALAAFLVIGFIYGKRLRVRQVLLPLSGLMFAFFLMDTISSAADYLVRERETIETMSDRIPLWTYLTTAVMRESPLTGLGYYAASRVVGTEYNAGLGNAHSAFFEVLVGGGLIGAALYIALCASLLRFAARALRTASGDPQVVAAAGLLVGALVLGLATPAALQPGPLGFAFWSLTAILPRVCREATQARIGGGQRLNAQPPVFAAGPSRPRVAGRYAS